MKLRYDRSQVCLWGAINTSYSRHGVYTLDNLLKRTRDKEILQHLDLEELQLKIKSVYLSYTKISYSAVYTWYVSPPMSTLVQAGLETSTITITRDTGASTCSSIWAQLANLQTEQLRYTYCVGENNSHISHVH